MTLTSQSLQRYVQSNGNAELAEAWNAMEYQFGTDVLFVRQQPRDGDLRTLTAPSDRTPRNTPLPVHKVLVGIFRTHGFEANRNNSIFAYMHRQTYTLPDESAAETTHVLLPIPPVRCTFSPEVHDLPRDSFATAKLKRIFPNLERVVTRAGARLDDEESIQSIAAKLNHNEDLIGDAFRDARSDEFLQILEFRREGTFTRKDVELAAENHSEILFTGKVFLLHSGLLANR